MLSFKHYIVLTCALLISSLNSYAQDKPEIENFKAVEFNGKVQLNWLMTEGSICNGIVILRSTDSINFKPVGNIAGICGSVSSAETYVFVDPSPIVNRKSFYQLEFGGLTYSDIISIEIYDVTGGNIIVLPNPAVNKTTVHFNNNDNSQHTLVLYSHDRKVAEYTTKDEYFELDLTDLKKGPYYFYIYDEDNNVITKGKLLKG